MVSISITSLFKASLSLTHVEICNLAGITIVNWTFFFYLKKCWHWDSFTADIIHIEKKSFDKDKQVGLSKEGVFR